LRTVNCNIQEQRGEVDLVLLPRAVWTIAWTSWDGQRAKMKGRRQLMTKKLLIAVTLVALIGLGVGTAFADTLTLSSSTFVGYVHTGAPSSESDEVVYINNLISVAANGSTTIDGHTYFRSSNTDSYPTAVLAGNSGNCTGCSNTSIDVTGFEYLLAKYGTDSYVWYVAGLTSVDIPSSLGQGLGLSHWTLFDPGTPPPPVPEPTSMALLGTGLFGMAGAIRRRLRK
jgi:hypothetical protein